jgi:hypothetical protein
MSDVEEPEDNWQVSRTQVENLSDMVLDVFPIQLKHRTIGLRTSFPIVGAKGKAGDSGTLWPFLRGDGFTEHRESNGMLSALIGTDYTFSVTTGRGMIEVQIPPCDNLHVLEERLQDAVFRLIQASERWNQSILAYGGQPFQTMDQNSLTHKYHYFSLLRKIKEPYCYRGLQAVGYIDVSVSREELLEQLNWGQILTPIFAMLSANSPILGNVDSYRPSFRMWKESQLEVGDGRWQMLEYPYSGVDEWVFHQLHQPHLLLRDAEGWLDPAEGDFGAYCSEKMAVEVWDDFLDHCDTNWTPTQPKLRSSVLQFNEIEQCGPQRQLALCAFALGLSEMHEETKRFLEEAVPDPPHKREFGLWPIDILNRALSYRKNIWTPMFNCWKDITSKGKFSEPFTGLLSGLMRYSEEGLIKRGLGEEGFLLPLKNRIDPIIDDTVELRRLWIKHGVDALIERCAIHHKAVQRENEV